MTSLATETAAVQIVVVECSYRRKDGRRMRQILLVPQASDPLYGAAVVNMRAENFAASQVRSHAVGSVFTKVRASIPLDSMIAGSSAPEIVVEDSPAIGHASPFREHV